MRDRSPSHLCFGQEEWGKGHKGFQAIKEFPQKLHPITPIMSLATLCHVVSTSVKKKAGKHCSLARSMIAQITVFDSKKHGGMGSLPHSRAVFLLDWSMARDPGFKGIFSNH